MARIKKQLTELIGGTPLLELSRFSKKQGAKAQVIAKLEYFNPGGSVKAVSYTHLTLPTIA